MLISILLWILFIMVFLLTFLWAVMLVGGISIMIDVRKYRYENSHIGNYLFFYYT